MGWTSQCSNPGIGKRIFSLLLGSGPDLRPIYLVLNGYRGSFSGLRWPDCEVDHSPPASAKLRMSGVKLLLPLYTFMELTGTTVA